MALLFDRFIAALLIFSVAFCVVIILLERNSFRHNKSFLRIILAVVIFLFEQD